MAEPSLGESGARGTDFAAVDGGIGESDSIATYLILNSASNISLEVVITLAFARYIADAKIMLITSAPMSVLESSKE